jgi:hypothetical protein
MACSALCCCCRGADDPVKAADAGYRRIDEGVVRRTNAAWRRFVGRARMAVEMTGVRGASVLARLTRDLRLAARLALRNRMLVSNMGDCLADPSTEAGGDLQATQVW